LTVPPAAIKTSISITVNWNGPARPCAGASKMQMNRLSAFSCSLISRCLMIFLAQAASSAPANAMFF